ncbi:MAG: DUF433 domain-containing protein [Bacteroidota bacterium]
MDVKQYIDSDPGIMLGKPKVKGTRITVELILRKLADGYSPVEIADMYPHISKEAVFAAIRYAAEVMESEAIIPAA